MNSKAKILIVDDLPKNIQLLGSILREKGFDIAFAKSGKEALKRVENNDFDLILLDIMMPGMDGFEVCKSLKDNDKTSDIPIIFLTAKNDTESTVKGFELGAVDYVTKPFNAIELLARVNTHLELKNKTKELVDTNQRLIELNSTKDKFFSIIAHDIRNPLVSFKGLTELLTKNYNDFTEEERLKFIHSMKNSAKHLYNLFENLLEWSRIQTNRTKFSPAPFNVNPIIEQVVTLMELSAQSKKIKVVNDLPKKDIEAFGDKQMFATILRNLVTNAIKFTPGNGEITISTIPGEEYVELSVKDNGVGIPNEDQSKLFRIDQHISKPGTKDEKGTGLGLILCKELVEKNSGQIWLESEEKKGSSFYFTFPNKEM